MGGAPTPGPSPPPGPPGPLPGCEVFHANQCQGNNIVTDPSFEANRWFTPLKGEAGHLPSFQDYGRLVAYTSVQYSDETLTAATVTVNTKHKDPSVAVTCAFRGNSFQVQNATQQSSSCKAHFSKEQTGPLSVIVKGSV